MKITAVKATPINIPMDAPYYWGAGVYPGTSKAIIEVETDEGVVGLGESPSWDCAEVIEKSLAPRLIGLDPLDITTCELRCVPEWKTIANTEDARAVKSFGGIEIALWDIRGKVFDMPLYKLLGGAVRKEIPFTEYFAWREENNGFGGQMSPEAIADYCVQMKEEHGATMFEGKLSGMGDPALEIKTVRLMREKLGEDAMIRLDANMAWSLTAARRICREIEEYNVRNYEDPVATFEEMKALRQHTTIPFSSHIPDIRRAVALGVPDTFVTNFAVLGGINKAIRFIGACEAMGVGFWCYSGDAGVCTAAYLHIVAATNWIHEPSQSLFRWQIDDVIENGPFRQKNNVIPVPEGPGLGIKLDAEGFKRCHQRFLDDGPMDDFINPYNPGVYMRLPRD